MHATPERHLSSRSDLLLATAAGPLVWATQSHSWTLVQRLALVGCAAALAGQTVTVIVLWSVDPANERASVVALASCLAALVVPGSHVLWLVAPKGAVGSTGSYVALRVAAIVAFTIGWTVIAPGAFAALIWPMGVYAGLEAAMTAIYVGSIQPAASTVRAVALSPLHLGTIFGLAVVAIAAGGTAVRSALHVALGFEIAVLCATVVFVATIRLARAEVDRLDDVREDERSNERRHRAHWIHDDVCAEVRTVRIKVATQELDRRAVASELDELDHRLRERQLDEVIRSGHLSAAEVMQPYLRRAQNAGVRLVEVPRFEEASIEVPGAAAVLLRRAVAGLISNAVAAGSTKLAIRLGVEAGLLRLIIEDDGGGFELEQVPAGRGLASLSTDLGSDRLRVDRGPDGAVVVVDIPLGTAE
jgi:signal transduction histidine kinase